MTTLLIYPELERDEGRRSTAYRDSLGNWTIGVGHQDDHLHEGVTWTDSMIDSQLRSDVSAAIKSLDGSPVFSPWWRDMDDPRQDALVNMTFNMGARTLSTFTTFLSLLRTGQYALAADDAIHTLWAKQVGQRAVRIAKQIETGIPQ